MDPHFLNYLSLNQERYFELSQEGYEREGKGAIFIPADEFRDDWVKAGNNAWYIRMETPVLEGLDERSRLVLTLYDPEIEVCVVLPTPDGHKLYLLTPSGTPASHAYNDFAVTEATSPAEASKISKWIAANYLRAMPFASVCAWQLGRGVVVYDEETDEFTYAQLSPPDPPGTLEASAVELVQDYDWKTCFLFRLSSSYLILQVPYPQIQ